MRSPGWIARSSAGAQCLAMNGRGDCDGSSVQSVETSVQSLVESAVESVESAVESAKRFAVSIYR